MDLPTQLNHNNQTYCTDLEKAGAFAEFFEQNVKKKTKTCKVCPEVFNGKKNS